MLLYTYYDQDYAGIIIVPQPVANTHSINQELANYQTPDSVILYDEIYVRSLKKNSAKVI